LIIRQRTHVNRNRREKHGTAFTALLAGPPGGSAIFATCCLDQLGDVILPRGCDADDEAVGTSASPGNQSSVADAG
jgi:hypothetical protein